MRKGKKNFTPQVLKEVEITDAGAEGKAIGKTENLVLFVDNAIPGDIVDIQIIRKKKSFAEGMAINFLHFSEKRTEPFCRHFGICGGCKWQHMKYEHQLFYKQKQVSDNFTRIGHIAVPEISPILASPLQIAYRNKLEYTFSDYRWLTEEDMQSGSRDTMEMNALGFHIPKHFDRVLDIDTCYLQEEPTNLIRNRLKEFCTSKGFTFYNPRRHTGFLRNLLIRNTTLNETMAIVVFGEEHEANQKKVLDHVLEIYPALTSLMFVVNTKHNDIINDLEIQCYHGKPFIEEVLGSLRFRIGPVSFFQTNSRQALNMYNIIKEFAGETRGKTIYDLYTGTGTIANFVALDASKVIGIEYIESAIDDAKINSEINNITNTCFIAGDIAKILNTEFVEQHGKPDIIITDPPRNGMHPAVVEQLLQIKPERIIYVSCNPATQARDLSSLCTQYQLKTVQPVDMFPHTHHVENVVLLELSC
ncbi:MAG TPA: 23S rRNA (uracil(1939)-C(5))-methyltransferase RlmD [Bacteroidales bacterium]|nr:23S rRNA (uracil(1939)-C(5))-methyltransferase RlmD [Bacteroidales bacterium]HPS26422.1 23S rRNA (uracil(1939)-C(5))-methyltransferase RlmD [Bacteroidales bacterium]